MNSLGKPTWLLITSLLIYLHTSQLIIAEELVQVINDINTSNLTEEGEFFQRLEMVEGNVENIWKSINHVKNFLKVSNDVESFRKHGGSRTGEEICNSVSHKDASDNGTWKHLTFTCVKLLPGLHTFVSASELCHDQIQTGFDIIHPKIMSMDLEKQRFFVREKFPVRSAWVLPTGNNTSEGKCTELRFPRGNDTKGEFEFKKVECGTLNNVICEKPVSIFNAELIWKTAENTGKLERLEGLLKNSFQSKTAENKKLWEAVEETESLVKNIYPELSSLDEKYKSGQDLINTELQRLEEQVEACQQVSEEERVLRMDEVEDIRLKMIQHHSEISSRMESVEESSRNIRLVAQGEHSGMNLTLQELKRKEEVTGNQVELVKTQIGKLDLWKEKTVDLLETIQQNQAEMSREMLKLKEEVKDMKDSTATGLDRLIMAVRKMERQAGVPEMQELRVWEAKSGFDVDRAVGVWYLIERFDRDYKASPLYYKCVEEEFVRDSGLLQHTLRRRDVQFNTKEDEYSTRLSVDLSSPFTWKGTSKMSRISWIRMDYDKWGVKVECGNYRDESCDRLEIVSRNRTLSADTLEMLRGFADERGFPRDHGSLCSQTSC